MNDIYTIEIEISGYLKKKTDKRRTTQFTYTIEQQPDKKGLLTYSGIHMNGCVCERDAVDPEELSWVERLVSDAGKRYGITIHL